MTESNETLGRWIIENAEILYWAQAHLKRNGDLVITGDYDGTDTKWPVTVTASQVEEAHRERLFHRHGIKGVHPANYGWLNDPEDFDAATGDWVIQHLVFGEVIYG